MNSAGGQARACVEVEFDDVRVRREHEQSIIESSIRDYSFLLIGDRSVGKTSLLNQIYGWVAEEEGLEAIQARVSSVSNEEELLAALRVSEKIVSSCTREVLADTTLDFQEMVRRIGCLCDSITPIFLLDEVEGLVSSSEDLLGQFKRIHEAGEARFILTACDIFPDLSDPKATAFDWTTGDRFHDRAFLLREFTESEAESLFALLEAEGLRWDDDNQKLRAFEILSVRSYRIPIILHTFLKRLKERSLEEKREVLYLQDVKTIMESELDIFEGSFQKLVLDHSSFPAEAAQYSAAARQAGCRLLLLCLVRNRYFVGFSPVIDDPALSSRCPKEFGFTATEAEEVLRNTINELFAGSQRPHRVLEWFDSLDLERALLLLSRSMFLEYDSSCSRFAFCFHLLPLELRRWQRGRVDIEPQIRGALRDSSKYLPG